MQVTLTPTDEGEWELDFDSVAILSLSLSGMKEIRDLLNRAIEKEDGI